MDGVGVPLTGKLLKQGRFVRSLLLGDRPMVSITCGGVYLFESQTGSERNDSGYLSRCPALPGPKDNCGEVGGFQKKDYCCGSQRSTESTS